MEYINTRPTEQERAVLVGMVLKQGRKEETESHLKELALLAETAGARPVKHFIQRLVRPNPATFVGSGMLEEIRDFVMGVGDP